MFLTESRIRKLSLVDVNMTEKCFDLLVQFLKSNLEIRELDVSWSAVRPVCYNRLLTSLVDNKRLQHLSLRWNTIVERKE